MLADSWASARWCVVPTWPNHSHEPNYLPSHNHLRRRNTDMDVRESFSRLKRTVKHLGRKRKPDRTGAGAGGERVDATKPLPRPESHLMASGGEWKGAGADGQQDFFADRPPQLDEPEPIPASRSNRDQEGEGVGVDGREVGQMYSRPYQAPEIAVGSGSGREGSDANGKEDRKLCSRSPTPSTLDSCEPRGAWT